MLHFAQRDGMQHEKFQDSSKMVYKGTEERTVRDSIQGKISSKDQPEEISGTWSVSYTHLDVYKRQV